MENLHNVSELLAWYQRVTGIGPPVHDITEDFEEMQDFAENLNLLQDCYSKAGSVSIISPSTGEPHLTNLHEAITTSSNSTYASRFLNHYSVRKFYFNFSLEDVNAISPRKTSKITKIELLTILCRMLQSQELQVDYPDIYENDLPYRS